MPGSPAATLEVRGALLRERGHAFLQVVARERAGLALGDLGAGAGAEPLRLGHEVQCALVAADGQRRRRRDLAREQERRAERVVLDVLHEPEAQRFLGVDGAAREQEVARRALPDELREPPDVAGAQVDAELAAGDREAGAERGDPHVARHRELHPRADRGAVDRGDDGRGVGDDRVEHLFERGPERVGGRRRRRAAKRVTRSAPAQNAVPAPVITIARRSRRFLEMAAQLVAQLAVQRVAPFLAVDRRDADLALVPRT